MYMQSEDLHVQQGETAICTKYIIVNHRFFFFNFELEWMTLLYSCQSPYSSTCYSPWLHKNLFWSPVDQYIQGTGLGVSLWVPPFDVLKISKVHAYTLFYSTLP